MMLVIHYPDTCKLPDILFNMDEKKEQAVLKKMGKQYDMVRSPDWYGHDVPAYPIHHYDATKK